MSFRKSSKVLDFNLADMAAKVEIDVQYAATLLENVFTKVGYGHEDAAIITHHLIDAELRGYGVAGLSRALSIVDFVRDGTIKINNTTIEKETASSAALDGHNGLGYVVAYEATKKAIDIAKESGVAVVAAKNTVFTGMLSYWAEMAAANDLVAIISSSTSAIAAPAGTTQALLGTNPFCIGIPSSDVPIIYDIGTSSSTYAEVRMLQRVGEQLRPGVAYDSEGNPTTDPDEAMKGRAFTVRDGSLGTGLSIMVQLMGAVAGAPAIPQPRDGFGFMITLFSPKLFGDLETYKTKIDEYVKMYHSAPTREGSAPPRIPFTRSFQKRQETRDKGKFEVFAQVVEELEAIRK